MPDIQTALAGGCQCGRVRYSLAIVPDDVSVCHCRMCQKAVGGPFIALALVHPDQMSWTRGKPANPLDDPVYKKNVKDLVERQKQFSREQDKR